MTSSFAEYIAQISYRALSIRASAIQDMVQEAIASGAQPDRITLHSFRLVSQEGGKRVDKEFVWVGCR